MFDREFDRCGVDQGYLPMTTNLKKPKEAKLIYVKFPQPLPQLAAGRVVCAWRPSLGLSTPLCVGRGKGWGVWLPGLGERIAKTGEIRLWQGQQLETEAHQSTNRSQALKTNLSALY